MYYCKWIYHHFPVLQLFNYFFFFRNGFMCVFFFFSILSFRFNWIREIPLNWNPRWSIEFDAYKTNKQTKKMPNARGVCWPEQYAFHTFFTFYWDRSMQFVFYYSCSCCCRLNFFFILPVHKFGIKSPIQTTLVHKLNNQIDQIFARMPLNRCREFTCAPAGEFNFIDIMEWLVCFTFKYMAFYFSFL